MNLNEDKRAPLREKDLSTKREMVLQYIVTAAKTVSLSKARTHHAVFGEVSIQCLPTERRMKITPRKD